MANSYVNAVKIITGSLKKEDDSYKSHYQQHVAGYEGSAAVVGRWKGA